MIRITGTILVGLMLAAGTTGHAVALTVVIQNNHNDASGGPLRLLSSKPYDRQVLNTVPEEVSLMFAQPIRPAKSYIRLYNSFGHQLDIGELESEGLTLSAGLPALSPGKYKVKWKARCACEQDTEISDHFYFTVR